MNPLRRMFATSFVVGKMWKPRRSRVRMMLHHTLLLTIAICLLAAGLVGAAFYVATRPATLKFAVGPLNGEDAKLVQAVHRHFSSDRANIQLRLVNTAGAAESAQAIDDKKADLAVGRQDIAMPKTRFAGAIPRQKLGGVVGAAPRSR